MKRIVVIGGGGHAKVLISTLKELQHEIIGILEKNDERVGDSILGVRIIGTDKTLGDFLPDDVMLVNGVGSIADTLKRTEIYHRFKKMRFSFMQVIHPKAFIASDVDIGEGAQIMAGAMVQSGTKIGKNTIINTGAIIEHDCLIEDHVHIAPGTVLSGGVKVGSETHVGVSVTIIQGLKIGLNCLIGAGSLVVKDIPDNTIAYGVPARIIGEKKWIRKN